MASSMQFTVGPPPYDSDTVITDGVVCYKCAEFSATTWMGLYMHLRHHCLTEDECLLLPGSYLVQEATREQSTAPSMQITAGPPPYDGNTVITDGVVCYKCQAFSTTSWMRLYMHLRHRCLTENECLLPRLAHTSSTRPGGRNVRLSPRRGSARSRNEGARPLEC